MPMMVMARWTNCQQQRVIEYLVEENRVLREQLRPPCRMVNASVST